MYYVYLLKSKKDSKHYIGYTNNLTKRLKEHNDGKVISTKSRRPLAVIYYEAYTSKVDALKREKNLKLFSKSYYGLKTRLKDTFTQ
ncbi:GIY-YIG nuclease family protein [Patescibacteria group bacterium]|nr:GIY-YIG nuclease family protein [Patescibacteria group bacterium]MBU1951844.1 GIY-YIG nuclease family protein [Patescibacteria group bacterium]MBU2236185.1 GIY-YIG nuclease family protein [Patescibacteria group bacterium]